MISFKVYVVMTKHSNAMYWVLCRDLTEQVGKIFEVAYTLWSLIGKPWDFPGGFDQNLKHMKRKRDELNGQKEDTTSRIKAELHPRKKVKKEVELWVENAKRINVEIQNLESEVEASSFLSRGFLGKNVCKKIEEVEELLEKGRFSDGLVVDDPSWTGQAFPTPSLVGETIKLKKDEILGYLMNNEVVKIGVHGMPGVGKTSVMKLVNNELLNDADKFNIVVWVTVSGESGVVELQNKIARAMDAVISEDEDGTIRAGILSEILGQKGRYVLILDDVREHFSLEEVGIPEPSASNGSKLVLTTRSLDVCRHMDCRQIKMETLPEADAWRLFLEKVGQDLMNIADLVPVARSVAEHCAGLPLAIIAVASSMKGEYSLPIWRNSFNELNRNVHSINGDVKDMVIQRLRFSYDRLLDPKIQKCFLICAAYPEYFGIHKEQLIRNWIRGQLVDNMGDMQANLDRGQAILRKLVDNCLLEDVGNGRVKMHDLVRDMALRIQHQLYSS
ncbi:probable disease resistance protein At1g15890 isoform X1 [Herrania umbratica]|uniref:Probable disease resistance protein At1g15890 isoform X1 n=2 Tax=Herrania umbratica TaxID=108875 RepID=A0A6J1AM66_9ROSI|nr:probable disease resistance protein At1g15890 isoform X1 [Herrania umbratica]